MQETGGQTEQKSFKSFFDWRIFNVARQTAITITPA